MRRAQSGNPLNEPFDDPVICVGLAIDTDQRFSTTFATAGTYDYFCALHPKMQGKVIVTRA